MSQSAVNVAYFRSAVMPSAGESERVCHLPTVPPNTSGMWVFGVNPCREVRQPDPRTDSEQRANPLHAEPGLPSMMLYCVIFELS